MRIELYYDVVSPYTYAAFVLLDRYREVWDASVELRPILLGGVMKSTGNTPPVMLPARAPYLVRDIGRLARRVGITLEVPAGFPTPTLKAMRLLTAVERDAPEALFSASLALFESFWARGENVETPEAQARALAAAGLGADRAAALLEASGSDAIKQALRDASDALVERGGFGAPTYFVDDEMYFGADRIEQLAFDRGLPYRGAHP